MYISIHTFLASVRLSLTLLATHSPEVHPHLERKQSLCIGLLDSLVVQPFDVPLTALTEESEAIKQALESLPEGRS